MRRPIIIISLSLICGIFLGSITHIPIYFSLAAGFLLWVFCVFCISSQKLTVFLPATVFALLFIISTAYYDCRTQVFPENHIKDLFTKEKSFHRITGTIIKPPITLHKTEKYSSTKNINQKISFIMRTKKIKTLSGWKNVTGVMKVIVYPSTRNNVMKKNTSPILNQLVYGQKVELFGIAFLPKAPDNPGEFHYKNHLLRKSPPIHVLMTVINENNIKTIKTSNRNTWYSTVYSLKNFLNNTIYARAFSKSAPLISSMLLGNRVDLPAETVDAFMKTGVIHFIAISGFHVGIVVFVVFLPLRFMGVNQTISTVIILGTIILYAFLTGLNPPVLRASIMAIVFFCGFFIRRQWDITSGIFTAVFIILIRNPSDLFNVGFQLSILATMGIVYGYSKIEGTLFKTSLFIEKLQEPSERGKLFFLKKYIRKLFCVSLAAWLATLPLTAYYFHIFTPFVPITSIIVFPFFCIIIVCGIVLLTVGIFVPQLALAAAWVASNADMVLENLVSTLSSLPYTYFYVSGPTQAMVTAYYLFILFLLIYKSLSLDLWRIVIFGLISANILLFSELLKNTSQTLKVTCLDAGHGCAIFIQFPNGKNMLYDVGTWHNYDIGKYIVAPFLWEQGIKKIDLVILSHEHNDHWNGLPSLIERFKIDTVYSQPHFFTSLLVENVLKELSNKSIAVAALSRGLDLNGFETKVHIVNPPPFDSNMKKINDNSCVIRIEYLGNAILLCGDISLQGIEAVVRQPDVIQSEIIQIPHHGSYANNLKKLIGTVNPSYAFINSHGNIISQKTLKLLKNKKIITLQTNHSGAITFTVSKKGISYTTFHE